MGKLFQIKEPWMRPSCGNEAKYACEHFHYSRVCPLVARSYSFFTPSSEFIGCVIFGHGATPNIGKPFGLEQNNCYELVRVALNGKQGHGQTSRIVAAAVRQFIKDIGRDLKMIISYADLDQGHRGIIYQATNWIYAGPTGKYRDGYILTNGRFVHRRSLVAIIKTMVNRPTGGAQSELDLCRIIFKDPDALPHYTKGRHLYLFPVSKDMKQLALTLRKPYPKDNDVTDNPNP